MHNFNHMESKICSNLFCFLFIYLFLNLPLFLIPKTISLITIYTIKREVLLKNLFKQGYCTYSLRLNLS